MSVCVCAYVCFLFPHITPHTQYEYTYTCVRVYIILRFSLVWHDCLALLLIFNVYRIIIPIRMEYIWVILAMVWKTWISFLEVKNDRKKNRNKHTLLARTAFIAIAIYSILMSWILLQSIYFSLDIVMFSFRHLCHTSRFCLSLYFINAICLSLYPSISLSI